MVEENKGLGYKDLFGEYDKGWMAAANNTGAINPHSQHTSIEDWTNWNIGFIDGEKHKEELKNLVLPSYMRNNKDED